MGKKEVRRDERYVWRIEVERTEQEGGALAACSDLSNMCVVFRTHP
jgi:hypothetical protein